MPILGLAAAWSGVLVFDCMIFCLTLKKALTFRNTGGGRLIHLLVRDGESFLDGHDVCSFPHDLSGRYINLCVGQASGCALHVLSEFYFRAIFLTSLANLLTFLVRNNIILILILLRGWLTRSISTYS